MRMSAPGATARAGNGDRSRKGPEAPAGVRGLGGSDGSALFPITEACNTGGATNVAGRAGGSGCGMARARDVDWCAG
jgi:hypothetical protein